jgi:hypothetical protein
MWRAPANQSLHTDGGRSTILQSSTSHHRPPRVSVIVRRLGEVTKVKQQAGVERLLRMLDCVKARPAMYFGQDEPEAASLFLIGFSAAAGAALNWDFDQWLNVREVVTTSRGWQWTSTGPHREMIAKGWSSSKIVAEMIDIEAEYIRQMTEASQTE